MGVPYRKVSRHQSKAQSTKSIGRREFLNVAGGMAAGSIGLVPAVHIGNSLCYAQQPTGEAPPSPFSVTPFQSPLPIPSTISPLAISKTRGKTVPPFVPGNCFHGIAPEFSDLGTYQQFPLQYYRLNIIPTVHEFIPGVKTPVWSYNGIVPGPTFKTRIGQPIVVRVSNNLNVETSVHLHGGHSPSHADGFPVFYTEPGMERDYFYPNTVPLHNGARDYSESVSTCWYHDHAMDLTGHNAYHGLAGVYLSKDEIETALTGTVLPSDSYDIPMIFSDKRFNADGTLYYDFLDHDGLVGDVFTVNGKAQPYLSVSKRKYRFRLCNGSNSRIYEFRLSGGGSFLQIAKDAWLLPYAVPRTTLTLAPGERADIVIDFRDAPKTVYLENILQQTDGRKPDGIAAVPTQLVRFDVGGQRITTDVTVGSGSLLRPHTPILGSEIQATRIFDLGRNNGVWTINSQLYDPLRVDATPKLGSAERWIFNNGSGGWWHPMHIHLESHQVISVNGAPPPIWQSFKSDTTLLQDNTTVELFMKFRTFKGPFVFHCHNMEHEDMRMMMNFQVV